MPRPMNMPRLLVAIAGTVGEGHRDEQRDTRQMERRRNRQASITGVR